jgi:DNA-binding XRE family transcriptional regulator
MIRAGESGPVKIGHSNNPAGRLIDIQIAHYEKIWLLRLFEGGEAEEAMLHMRFADLHIRGEWHSFSRLMLGDVGLVEILPEAAPDKPASLINTEHETARIGGDFRAARKAMGLTQQQAADGLGVARSTLASIEIGHGLPGRDLLLCASKFFNVPLLFSVENKQLETA